MGSATREAIVAATATLAQQSAVNLAVGEQLLAAALVVDGSHELRTALADDAAGDADRKALVDSVFKAYEKPAKAVLETLATSRWSSEDDLVAGIEELGIRSLAASVPAEGTGGAGSIDNELFEFGMAVASDSELELALGSKLGGVDGKVSLIESLLKGKASAQTLAILKALVAQPRGRRIAVLIRYAATIVADQSGLGIATVTVASAIDEAQRTRLATTLRKQYGRDIRLNEIIDPQVLGGMRVQVGSEVIDGTIANRIADLRLRLAS
ncbi:MAG TPA: F0F1 ATP synthase subunit delta [Galbitalea sp.]|jgi:F-type H+-transporting ATPase subunit delta|nr:F0F1 ATP synthase subunit delta [Galbitalea sp.]